MDDPFRKPDSNLPITGNDFKLISGNPLKMLDAINRAQIDYKDGVAYEEPDDCIYKQPCPDGMSLTCMQALDTGNAWFQMPEDFDPDADPCVLCDELTEYPLGVPQEKDCYIESVYVSHKMIACEHNLIMITGSLYIDYDRFLYGMANDMHGAELWAISRNDILFLTRPSTTYTTVYSCGEAIELRNGNTLASFIISSASGQGRLGVLLEVNHQTGEIINWWITPKHEEPLYRHMIGLGFGRQIVQHTDGSIYINAGPIYDVDVTVDTVYAGMYKISEDMLTTEFAVDNTQYHYWTGSVNSGGGGICIVGDYVYVGTTYYYTYGTSNYEGYISKYTLDCVFVEMSFRGDVAREQDGIGGLATIGDNYVGMAAGAANTNNSPNFNPILGGLYGHNRFQLFDKVNFGYIKDVLDPYDDGTRLALGEAGGLNSTGFGQTATSRYGNYILISAGNTNPDGSTDTLLVTGKAYLYDSNWNFIKEFINIPELDNRHIIKTLITADKMYFGLYSSSEVKVCPYTNMPRPT